MNTKQIALPRRLLMASAASVALLASFPIHAADEAPETIIVTAQRRAERLENVPITISNISTETLSRISATSLRDVARVTPGVRFDVRGAEYQPTIRGVGTTVAVAGGGSNVGIYVDGFFVSNPNASDFQLLNVENIQVLKGPQGTLFGRNTTGGAIQVNTTKPSSQTKAILEASYGSYNAQRYQGYVTVGLSDRIAVDFGGSFSKGDGYITNIFTGNDRVARYRNSSYRVGAKADLTDNLSFTLRYGHQSWNDPKTTLLQPYVLNGRVYAQAFYRAGNISPTTPNQISNETPYIFLMQSDTVQLTGSLDLGFGTITSYTQYYKDRRPRQQYSQDFSNLAIFDINTSRRERSTTQEFLLTSKPGSRLQYTAGVFYYDNFQSFTHVDTSVNGAPFTFSSENGANVKSIAAYGDVTYEVVDNLFLTGGLRYTHDKILDGFSRSATTRLDFPTLTSSRVTPRAVMRYQLTGDSSVYASFSKGFKGAIWNVGGGAIGLANPIRPEDLTAFEVGYKYGSRDFSFNVSSYFYNYKNEQLSSFFTVNNVPMSLITNAASSHIYGIDADFRYSLTRDFEVNVAASWNHSRFRTFLTAPFFTENPTTHAFTNSPRNASGGHMARSPDFSANIGATYTVDVADGKLALSGNLYYTAKLFFDVAEQLPQKGYALLNLRAAWTDPSERYTIAVSGSNVTNTHYYLQASSGAQGVGAAYGPPPMVEGSLRVRF